MCGSSGQSIGERCCQELFPCDEEHLSTDVMALMAPCYNSPDPKTAVDAAPNPSMQNIPHATPAASAGAAMAFAVEVKIWLSSSSFSDPRLTDARLLPLSRVLERWREISPFTGETPARGLLFERL
jgi:hypothetical protein